MKILLTNDDGYNTKGILKIYNLLKEVHDVTIVAPFKHQSAKSSAISIFSKMDLIEIKKNYFALDGTPADCVKFAIEVLNYDFDLVISGANNGYNVSHDIVYSGTCGAAFEGVFKGVNSIAFSCYPESFAILDTEFMKTFNYIINNNFLDNNSIINVNFPNSKTSKGIKKTFIYDVDHNDVFIKNKNQYTLEGRYEEIELEEGSDLAAVRNGYTSISKLKNITSVEF